MSLQSTFLLVHTSSWPVLLILFLLSYRFTNQKITMMLTRLFAILMIVSGFGMVIIYGFPLIPLFKAFLALSFIGIMESLVARKRRNERNGMRWIIWGLLLITILSLGYSL